MIRLVLVACMRVVGMGMGVVVVVGMGAVVVVGVVALGDQELD